MYYYYQLSDNIFEIDISLFGCPLQPTFVSTHSLTNKINQFLFLGVEDIFIVLSCSQPLPLPHTRQENIFIVLHHGSDLILINKKTIVLHKYFKINLWLLLCYLRIKRSCTFHGASLFFSPLSTVSIFVYFK